MWEYDQGALQGITELPDAVLERVMLRGGRREMRWLLHSVPVSRVRSYLAGRGRRVLPPRELRFWCWVARVEEPTATEWVRESRERERSWRS